MPLSLETVCHLGCVSPAVSCHLWSPGFVSRLGGLPGDRAHPPLPVGLGCTSAREIEASGPPTPSVPRLGQRTPLRWKKGQQADHPHPAEKSEIFLKRARVENPKKPNRMNKRFQI